MYTQKKFRHIRFGQFVNKRVKTKKDKPETEKSSKFDAKFTDETIPKTQTESANNTYCPFLKQSELNVHRRGEKTHY